MIFQIVLFGFAALAMLRTWRQYKKEHISAHWLQVWSLLWVLVMLVAISPVSTDRIAEIVGVGRGADLIVYTAIVFLLYGFSRLIATQERQRKELTDLVRKIAIERAEKKQDRE